METLEDYSQLLARFIKLAIHSLTAKEKEYQIKLSKKQRDICWKAWKELQQ